MFRSAMRPMVSIPLRGIDDESRTDIFLLILVLLLFPSPCGELMMKGYPQRDRREIPSIRVSIPLRGIDDESIDQLAESMGVIVYAFPSPCGELMMKEPIKLLIDNEELFPSPCGELMMKDAEIAERERKRAAGLVSIPLRGIDDESLPLEQKVGSILGFHPLAGN